MGNVMKREMRQVCYSYEHGDETLPSLKDLVSATVDPEKSKILKYLRMHCILASVGILRDEINPNNGAVSGNVFSDGTYFWNDQFTYYVERYNIPVPSEFRQHILKNYVARMKRHALLKLVDAVEVMNNPYLGYRYRMRIDKNGFVKYWNITDCKDGAFLLSNPGDFDKVNPAMTELFCYDADEHGKTVIDGYYWKITFFKKGEILDVIEGRSGEDIWRFKQVKRIIECIEHCIPKDMGSHFMEYVPG